MKKPGDDSERYDGTDPVVALMRGDASRRARAERLRAQRLPSSATLAEELDLGATLLVAQAWAIITERRARRAQLRVIPRVQT